MLEEVTTRTICNRCQNEIPPGKVAIHIHKGSHVIGEYGASVWEGDYCNKNCFLAEFNWLYNRLKE